MKRAGFTLIEVLIAISILSVIVLVLYASFSSVTNTMEAARVSSEELRLRMFLQRSFRSNLMSIYTDRTMENEVFRFVGVDDETRDGPNDNLRFVSVNTLMGGKALPGDLKEVRYGTIGGEESEFNPIDFNEDSDSPLDDQLKLQALETPIFGSNAQELDEETGFLKPSEESESSMGIGETPTYEAPSWSVPIRTVDFSYFDGLEWVDEWDSQLVGRIPWCVRVRINFARTEEQLEEEKRERLDILEYPDFDMVVPLPPGLGTTQDARSLQELSELSDEEIGDIRNPAEEEAQKPDQVIGSPGGGADSQRGGRRGGRSLGGGISQ
ncbi:MAG: hypothetical protein AMXMBFR82_17370 [Candidatus Hydrogenedentota bacterium]